MSENPSTPTPEQSPETDSGLATCLQCKAGFHEDCQYWWDDALPSALDCCCAGEYSLGGQELDAGLISEGEPVAKEDTEFAYFDGFNGLKKLSEYADPLSSGRKEAKRVAPIDPGALCEWAWLAEAGGGIEPIIGCPGHPMSDRHHGPDKNTMRNSVGTNLHRICDWCHNTWHARNDPYYGPRPTIPDQFDAKGEPAVDASKPFLPLPEFMDRMKVHNPVTKATDEAVFAEEARRRADARRHGNID